MGTFSFIKVSINDIVVSSQYLLLSHQFDCNCSQTNMELRKATMKKKEKEKRRKEKMEEFNLNDQSVEKKRETNMEA